MYSWLLWLVSIHYYIRTYVIDPYFLHKFLILYYSSYTNLELKYMILLHHQLNAFISHKQYQQIASLSNTLSTIFAQ